jgi:hypothetical protein
LEGTGKRGVTARDYLEQVLEPIVSPAFHGLLGYPAEPITELGEYVEDAAPIHGKKSETGCLVVPKQVLGIPVHLRPTSSPDLNPIENCWRVMKQRIKQRPRFPGTVEEMRKAVQEEWDRLDQKLVNKYIESMPQRIAQLKQRKGLQTQY